VAEVFQVSDDAVLFSANVVTGLGEAPEGGEGRG